MSNTKLDRVSELQMRFWAGELTRNEFLRRAAVLGVSASVLGRLTMQSASYVLAAERSRAWASGNVTFVWSDFQEPTTLDPALAQDSNSYSVIRNIYEPLVEIDPVTQRLIPRLALSWTPSGHTWTFTLRRGVTFHDGTPFDAAAAAQSIKRVLKINQGPAFLISDIVSVKVVDSHTLSVTTKAPMPFLPAHLVKIGIVSPTAIKQHEQGGDSGQHWLGTNAVGTGPYIAQPWQHGARLTLNKNTKWWHGWQPGSIDTVIFNPSSNVSVRVEMLQRGTADMIGWPPLNEATRVSKGRGFHLQVTPTYDTDPALYLNVTKAPLNNPLVRRALQYVFDYNAMKSYYQGFAAAPGGPIPSDFPYGAQGLAPFRQDFALAKRLLDQAHVSPSSIKLDFVVPAGFAEFAFGATAFQAAAKKMGITVNLTTVPWSEMLAMYSKPSTSGHITDFAQSPFTADPTLFMTAFFQTGGLYNMSKYSNPQVDHLLTAAARTFDAAAQKRYMSQAQTIVRDQAVCIWGARPRTVDAVPDYVRGYVIDRTDYRWSMKFYLIRIAAH